VAEGDNVGNSSKNRMTREGIHLKVGVTRKTNKHPGKGGVAGGLRRHVKMEAAEF